MQLAHGTYSASDLAAAIGGRQVAGAPTRRLGPVSIDSRAIAPGDLFFAIVAARDGHDFVPAATPGAAGVVVQRPMRRPPRTRRRGRVPTRSPPLESLGRRAPRLGRPRRRHHGQRRRDHDGCDCRRRRREVPRGQNRGNQTTTSACRSAVEMRGCPGVAVMELGMDHAGEIRVLVGGRTDIRV
jgi:UDP-N-acetylmuramoyl-tripeptide--D-alanyl-D-alanine ligase